MVSSLPSVMASHARCVHGRDRLESQVEDVREHLRYGAVDVARLPSDRMGRPSLRTNVLPTHPRCLAFLTRVASMPLVRAPNVAWLLPMGTPPITIRGCPMPGGVSIICTQLPAESTTASSQEPVGRSEYDFAERGRHAAGGEPRRRCPRRRPLPAARGRSGQPWVVTHGSASRGGRGTHRQAPRRAARRRRCRLARTPSVSRPGEARGLSPTGALRARLHVADASA